MDKRLSKLVVAPSFAGMLVFIYGFLLWTMWISLTTSSILPVHEFAGLSQYKLLFSNERWGVALKNLLIFSGLFISLSFIVGLTLAIFLDQKIRVEGFLRSIYLYPMALSFIVTGTVWKWILSPDWLGDPNKAIYAVVLAGVWQSSGFVMALFLAGLRGFDVTLIKAAQIDGASSWQIYTRVILPNMLPTFFSVLMILSHVAIKSFDLIMSLTGGGPGYATDMPATFMYTFSFTRNQTAMGAASAVMMLFTTLAVLVPYLYSQGQKREGSHA